MKTVFTKTIFLIVICIVYTLHCNAQWSTDSNVDNALNATIAASGPDMTFCTDGHGGAIYTWLANTVNGRYLVYANRIDSLGNIRWGSAGVLLHSDSLATVVLPNPSVCEDGKGGCYVAFSTNTISSHPVICQHLDSSGIILWGAQGKLITTTFSSQYYQAFPSLINDNGKGLFITFFNNAGSASGLYAQRLNFNGAKQWGSSASAIEIASDIRQPIAISDGKNGIAVAWTNYSFDGLGHQFQIRMNRLDHNGSPRFSFGSKKLNTLEAIGYGPYFRLILTNKKNYIAVWTSDGINTPRVYSQKIDSLGNSLWGTEIKVRDTTAEAIYPDILSDGADGAYYVWLDGRKINVAYGVFAQHVISTGVKKWKSQGLQIDSNAINSPHIAPDVNKGMKIFWTSEPANRDYMQQLDKNGIAQLAGIGVAVAAANHYPSFYQRILPVSNNHDILFLRLNGTGVSFAKRVPLDGVLPLTMISFNAVNQGAINVLSWQTTSEKNTNYFSVERSEDGNNFFEITRVRGNNNSTVNNYNYSDASSLNKNVYYRLKEADADGNVTYSNISIVHNNINNSIRIVPNPASENCTIYFDGIANGNTVLKIFDMSGVQKKQIALNIKQSSATIDVSSFATGTYFCRVELAGRIFTEKLIVVKQ